MRITIRPVMEPEREVDLTSRLVSAIADELQHLYGGNEQLNRLEAERQLEGIVAHAFQTGGDAGSLLGATEGNARRTGRGALPLERSVGESSEADGGDRWKAREPRRLVLAGALAAYAER